MQTYFPDYTRLLHAARRKKPETLPMYEHNISYEVASALTGRDLVSLADGNERDKTEFFRQYGTLCRDLGYDVIPYEGGVVEIVQGGKALQGAAGPIIQDKRALDNYPWKTASDRYFARFSPYFDALAEALREPALAGMKAVGGIGYGIFETTQDFVPLTELAYLEIDEPEAFELLWRRVGDMFHTIWKRFLERYGDIFAVCRMGDDLGFKTSTLLKPVTIKRHILPQYRRIVELVHDHGKPFLLHTCGNLLHIMDDIIETGIDAKHSNEDEIAPFSKWLDLYGKRLALFGGIDMNVLCIRSEGEIKEYVTEVLRLAAPYPGYAAGSGNQIARYIPPEGFLAMVEAIREFRGV